MVVSVGLPETHQGCHSDVKELTASEIADSGRFNDRRKALTDLKQVFRDP